MLAPALAIDDGDWLPVLLERLAMEGYAVLEGAVDEASCRDLRTALYRAQAAVVTEVGQERLQAAGELGVVRIPMRFDPAFLRLLELPAMLDIVDATVSETAVLHLQNGFVLPSLPPGEGADAFQRRFHMDFRRVVNGYLMSVNVLVAVDAFSAENGGTLIVPGSHQAATAPSAGYLRDHAAPVECPAGSLIVFDSTLWHAVGENRSGSDRLAINHQFTRSYVKQQIDYCRALGDAVVLAQPDRTQQLLGWYTRTVTSLEEYYRPPDARLYRAGQG